MLALVSIHWNNNGASVFMRFLACHFVSLSQYLGLAFLIATTHRNSQTCHLASQRSSSLLFDDFSDALPDCDLSSPFKPGPCLMACPAHREDKNLLWAEGKIIGMLSPLTLLERSVEKTWIYHSGPGMLWHFWRCPELLLQSWDQAPTWEKWGFLLLRCRRISVSPATMRSRNRQLHRERQWWYKYMFNCTSITITY